MHELPHACRAHAGDGDRVQGRFDDGHVFEFQRQAVTAEGFFEDRHVVLGQAEDLSHLGGHFLGVEDHVILDGLIVRQLDEGVHPLEALDEDAVRNFRGKADAVHVISLSLRVFPGLAVEVPDAQEAVGRVVLEVG